MFCVLPAGEAASVQQKNLAKVLACAAKKLIFFFGHCDFTL
jgi:hypothetical protein